MTDRTHPDVAEHEVEFLEAVIGISIDYTIVGLMLVNGPRCKVCAQPAKMKSTTIVGDAWCLVHFVVTIAERTRHELARIGHPDEVARLERTVHRLYHDLDDMRTRVEDLAGGFPECQHLELPEPGISAAEFGRQFGGEFARIDDAGVVAEQWTPTEPEDVRSVLEAHAVWFPGITSRVAVIEHGAGCSDGCPVDLTVQHIAEESARAGLPGFQIEGWYRPRVANNPGFPVPGESFVPMIVTGFERISWRTGRPDETPVPLVERMAPVGTLDLDCPTCHARPGEPCMTVTGPAAGSPIAAFHASRWADEGATR